MRRSRDSSLDMLAREEKKRRAKMGGEKSERRVRAEVLEKEEDTWETLRASTEEIIRGPPRRQGRTVEDNTTEKSRWSQDVN